VFQYARRFLKIFFSDYSKRGFNVRSFGSGTHVKLPGLAPDRPNIYDFNTTYDEMFKDLSSKDAEAYVFWIYICILKLKPIVVAIQWALVRTYWIDEPLE